MTRSILIRVSIAIVLLPIIIAGLYVLSILDRVGNAEQALFGRNYLTLFSNHPRQYTEEPTAESHGDYTYTFVREGKSIKVYKQLTNSFQHVYGSALSAYELGNSLSDLLFRANEYAESLVEKNAGTMQFYLDTKKDLANNAVGRTIAKQAAELNLDRSEAEAYLLSESLAATSDGRALLHYADARVLQLPPFSEFDCPGLQQIQEARRANRTVSLQ